MKLNDRELATVLAALRLWQEEIKIYGSNMQDKYMVIAENCNSFKALTKTEIDKLCEKINSL